MKVEKGMKPLLVNAQMALAIQDGRKTVTRRAIKPMPGVSTPSYKKGDILWVREPARVIVEVTEELHFEYLSDGKQSVIEFPHRLMKDGYTPDWMAHGHGVPNGCIKEMARTFVRVTDVKVGYLHDIGDNYRAEGFETLEDFILTWDKVVPRGYRWDDNPPDFAYRFEEAG